jgi:hypothetical protein
MHALAHRAVAPACLPQFSALEVSAMAWAYATLGVHNAALMERLATHFTKPETGRFF